MPSDLKQLDHEFNALLYELYEKAKQEKYYATYFKKMLDELGGVNTAKHLLERSEIQEGLMRLWELNMLKDSVEAAVILEKFRPLFTPQEIAEASRRLESLNYFKDKPK